MVVRAGVIYERWMVEPAAGNCDVLYFIPNGCQAYTPPPSPSPGPQPPPPPPSLTSDHVGLLAALRFDAPVQPIYVAFDAEVAAAADVDQSVPGVAITGQLVLTIALRDHARARKGPERLEPRLRRF